MMDPAARSIATDLVNHMKFYHESIGNDINILARGIVGKDWNAMDFEDMRVMNNYFNEMRTGGWFSNNWGKMKEGVPMVSKRHWMLFPRAVGEETMIKDFVVAKEQGFFKNYKGQDTPGTIGRPTNYIERSQFIIGKNSDFAQHKNATEEENLRRELRDETGYETIPEGEAIYNVAFIQRDAHISQRLKDNPDLGSNQKKQLLDSYNQTIESVKKASNWDIIKDKEFYIKTSKGTERLTGQQIADKIDNILTKHAIQKMKWIKGSHYDWNPVSEKYEAMGKDPLDKFYMKKGGKVQYWGESKIPRVNSNLLFKDLMQHLREGKEIPMDYGLDGMRNVLKSVMMENKMLNPEEINILSKVKAEDTKSYRPWEYNPHVIRDPKAAQDAIKKQIKLISEMQGPKWTAEKKNEEIQRLVVDYQRLSGDYLVQDVVDSQMFTDVFRNIAEGKRGKDNPILKMWDRNPKAGNQHSRTSHWPGWETSPDVWEGYQKNLIDTYYRQISQLMSRKLFNEFTDKYKDKWPEDLFTGWTNFYADYINGAMGYPNYIPQEWLKGDMAKVMNVKGTPYAWWADNRVADRVNKIAKSLGMEKGSAALPPELRKFDVHDIRNWSNMEAKYQMAALLAHPKSAIANIYGGTLHTVESVGLKTWKDAGNLDLLRKKIGGKALEWNDMGDAYKWLAGHGVVPEFMEYEFSINPEMKSAKWKEFGNSAMDIIKGDSNVKFADLKQLARKHKISDAMFEKAAWFMREPERRLRGRAFLAHYLAAREHFGNANMPLDHPFLINQAKKGVQATQFLYNAPYRPAFSRTALGKVMTRFQTWAWNSVRFRRDVMKEARLHNYRQGSPEFDRLKRMMSTDLFVYALSGVFAYSLFEAALPAPYSWLQDTSDWIFGDEKERDRAFFGAWPTAVAPLQMVTPAALRMVPATFSAVVNDDYSRLSGYYLWSMFPFGRIAYDTKGAIQNPFYTVEKATGIPYMQIGRVLKGGRDD